MRIAASLLHALINNTVPHGSWSQFLRLCRWYPDNDRYFHYSYNESEENEYAREARGEKIKIWNGIDIEVDLRHDYIAF